MEVLICVMLTGVLAASAVPVMQGVINRNRENEAITYLNIIRTAEKIYYLRNDATYYPIGTQKTFAPNSTGDLAAVNQALNVDLGKPKSFAFTISTNSAPDPNGKPIYHYQVMAERSDNYIYTLFMMTDTGAISRQEVNTQPNG